MAEIATVKDCLQRQRQLLQGLVEETDMVLSKIDLLRQKEDEGERTEARQRYQRERSPCPHVKRALVMICSGPRDNGEYTYRCCQCGLIL